MPFKIGNQYAKGNKHTEEWKAKTRERMLGNTNGFVKGNPAPMKGRKLTDEHKQKLSLARIGKHTGESHHLWISDRTRVLEKHRMRASIEWREWREEIFKRDDYTCQDCGVKGVYLEPHHIISLREDITKIFEADNGITLCRNCHKKTMRKEEKFREKYLLKLS